MLLSRFDDVLIRSADSMDLPTLAKHAFLCAQKFNSFYHKHKILGSPEGPDKWLNTAVAFLFRREMGRAMDLMGIPVPARM